MAYLSGSARRGLRLGARFLFSGRCRQVGIDLGRFERMDLVVIGVRLGQLLLAHEQGVESLAAAQFKNLVHLDGFERTDFDANLATHADGDIDVESRRIKLLLAHVIGLLVLALDDVDALRRTFLLANLARYAAQTGLRVVGVEHQERKVPVVLRQRVALLRILDGDQPILLEITPDEVSQSHGHSIQNAKTNHRSTSPITISMLPRITITSATVCPRQRSSKIVRLMKLGGRTR